MENAMTVISEKIVEALPIPERGNKLHHFPHARLQGKECPVGFAVRVTANGAGVLSCSIATKAKRIWTPLAATTTGSR